MKIAVIYNQYLPSDSYLDSISLYVDGLKKSGFDAFKISSSKLILQKSFDFSKAILLDKDIALGYTLENHGVRVYNSPDAIRICDSKILTHIFLKGSALPLPETIILPFKFSNQKYSSFEFLNNIKSFPVVIKEEFGSLGQQIYIANNPEEIKVIIENSSSRFLIQEYIECDNSDIRVFVAGGKALCAMKRHNENNFRSNCALGGKGEAYPLNEEISKIAEKAAETLGLTFCGVDIIKGKNKYYLIEVNSNPLINNLAQVCNINPGFEIGNIIK